MNEVSQFIVNDPSSIIQKPLSLTPNTIHFKSQPQTHSTINSQTHHHQSPSLSSFKCQQCPEHLSNLTQIKKREIKLQYEIEKFKQEIQHLKRENQHLKQLQYNYHQQNLSKYNPIMYFKQDLQAELYQAKYLLQLHTLSKAASNQQSIIHNSKQLATIKQSQKQKQSLQKLSKPIDLKTKCEQLLLENIKLQQKNMIKDKIIEQRVLFPLYHYDERILMLRKAVQHWYRRAEQESVKLSQVLIQVKKYQKELKREAKTMVLQQKTHWENQFKKILLLLQLDETTLKTITSPNSTIIDSLKNSHNQIQQKRLFSKSYNNNNILIQEDHTIYSLCQKINSKSTVQQRQKQKMTKRNSLKNPHILCQSCLNLSVGGQNRKKIKNCSMINKKQQKSINKVGGKNSAKNQNKYDTGSIQRKSEDFAKKTVKRKNGAVDANNNSSILGKNFENIEIKVKPKEKCQVNCKKTKNAQTKCHLSEFSCQRCAERIM